MAEHPELVEAFQLKQVALLGDRTFPNEGYSRVGSFLPLQTGIAAYPSCVALTQQLTPLMCRENLWTNPRT